MNSNLETKSSEMIAEPSEKPKNTLFQIVFWRTIIVLFIFTVVMIILGAIHHSDKTLKEAHNERALSAESLKKIIPVLAVVYKDIDTIAYPKSFQNEISRKVDAAFLPVYQNIPNFVDMHYSVIGEYTEIGLAAVGDLSSSIQTRLFHGFNEDKLSSDIGDIIPNTLQQMMKKLTHDGIKKIQIPMKEQQAFKQAIEQALEKQMTKFRVGMTLGGGVFGAVGGIATVKLMATMIARKLLVKLGAKLAAKLALKSGSAAGLAAAGAAIGSVVPVAGTVVGGVVGAIVGWVAVDVAFVSVDEWLNRDEFEAYLRMEITQKKEIMKKQFIQYADDIKSKLSVSGKKAVTGKAPSDL